MLVLHSPRSPKTHRGARPHARERERERESECTPLTTGIPRGPPHLLPGDDTQEAMLHIINLVEQGQSHLVPWTGGNPLQATPQHHSRPVPTSVHAEDRTAAAASSSEGPHKRRRTQAPDDPPEATSCEPRQTSSNFSRPLLVTKSP